jgi:hypothetical protein
MRPSRSGRLRRLPAASCTTGPAWYGVRPRFPPTASVIHQQDPADLVDEAVDHVQLVSTVWRLTNHVDAVLLMPGLLRRNPDAFHVGTDRICTEPDAPRADSPIWRAWSVRCPLREVPNEPP